MDLSDTEVTRKIPEKMLKSLSPFSYFPLKIRPCLTKLEWKHSWVKMWPWCAQPSCTVAQKASIKSVRSLTGQWAYSDHYTHLPEFSFHLVKNASKSKTTNHIIHKSMQAELKKHLYASCIPSRCVGTEIGGGGGGGDISLQKVLHLGGQEQSSTSIITGMSDNQHFQTSISGWTGQKGE